MTRPLASRNARTVRLCDRRLRDAGRGRDGLRMGGIVGYPSRPASQETEGETTMERLDNARVLIYSHDSFGLGHLRRCRAIAHAIVDRYTGVSVLILSGSPIIGSFDFLPRVDFVRIPGVVKLTNGEHQSLGLHIESDQTMAIRAEIIEQTE